MADLIVLSNEDMDAFSEFVENTIFKRATDDQEEKSMELTTEEKSLLFDLKYDTSKYDIMDGWPEPTVLDETHAALKRSLAQLASVARIAGSSKNSPSSAQTHEESTASRLVADLASATTLLHVANDLVTNTTSDDGSAASRATTASLGKSMNSAGRTESAKSVALQNLKGALSIITSITTTLQERSEDFSAINATQLSDSLVKTLNACDNLRSTLNGIASQREEKYDVSPVGKPGGRQNWVDKVGGLPLYIRAIAHALIRTGHDESRAIQLAIGAVQRWARGEDNVTAKTRAKAAAALAEWERKKAEAHAKSDIYSRLIEMKAVRHVRTPSGERRFGQPIGSIIVADGAAPLVNLRTLPKRWSDWDYVEGRNGKRYDVGQDEDGKWRAYNADDETDVIAEAGSEADVYRSLDKIAGSGKGRGVAVQPGPKEPDRNTFAGLKPGDVYRRPDSYPGHYGVVQRVEEGKGGTTVNVTTQWHKPDGTPTGVPDTRVHRKTTVHGGFVKPVEPAKPGAGLDRIAARNLRPGMVLGSGERLTHVYRNSKTPSGRITVEFDKDGKHVVQHWNLNTPVHVEKQPVQSNGTPKTDFVDIDALRKQQEKIEADYAAAIRRARNAAQRAGLISERNRRVEAIDRQIQQAMAKQEGPQHLGGGRYSVLPKDLVPGDLIDHNGERSRVISVDGNRIVTDRTTHTVKDGERVTRVGHDDRFNQPSPAGTDKVFDTWTKYEATTAKYEANRVRATTADVVLMIAQRKRWLDAVQNHVDSITTTDGLMEFQGFINRQVIGSGLKDVTKDRDEAIDIINARWRDLTKK
jgi:hypothetical protein